VIAVPNKNWDISSVQPKRAKIAFFCIRCDIKDLDEIYDFAKGRYSVRVFEGGGIREAFELMKWCTICWFEGLDDLTVLASHLPKCCRNIVRLDKDEIRNAQLTKINWQNIDVLFVDDTEETRKHIPGINLQTLIIANTPNDSAAHQGCNNSAPTGGDRGQTISMMSELFGRLERNPFYYNKEVDFCRDRLIRYCQGKGLDVGCGDNKVRPDAIGIDLADLANEVVADARSLPFEDGSMDYLFSSHCLEDLEDTGAAIAEWMRVLRTGGNLVLYLPHKNFYPRVGTPDANPAHKHDLDPNFVLAALSETNDYEILHIDEACEGGQHSFSLVVRKLHRELPERKVLVQYHAAIGDAICMEPALRSLKQQLGDDVAIILRVTHPELFRNHPSVSRVENTLFPLRCRNYEKFYELSIKPTKPNRRCHLVDRAAEQIGVTLDDKAPRLYLDKWDEVMLQKFNLPGTDQLKIAISPYVRWPSRQWEGQKWNELCCALKKELGAMIIQLGMAGSYTASFGLDLVGKTSPREAAAVLSKCDLLVSLDTGLAHLAAAVGTPCVGIFGPVYPELRMHPGLARAVISADAECRGCFHWYDGDVNTCPKNHHECMRLISVEAVLRAIYRLIEPARSPRDAAGKI